MSISSTLSSALSGLTASARAAELVSSNVANALTEGYARRELEITSRSVGGSGQGVSVVGVRRVVDQALVSDRRIAEAGADDLSLRADFQKKLETALGTPETEGSLTERVAKLETALIEATSHPESEPRLTNIVDTARAVASTIRNASDVVQDARTTADSKIAKDVDLVNKSLARLAEMNEQIRNSVSSGRDASALMDQRQQLVDKVATVIPVREVARDHEQIALYTAGGAVLLDGRPSELGFTAVGMVVPEMSQASGALSGLTLNGRAIRTSGEDSLVAGGTLAANFAIRDELAPEAQARLDAVARDLVERFSDPAVDPTLTAGTPGLFTDAGSGFSATKEVGLAGRLTVNEAVDPREGGDLRLLRDGIGATQNGATGNSRQLTALHDAMTKPRPTTSGGFSAGNRSAATLASDLLSATATDRLTAESDASYASSRSEALRVMELQTGVDTDYEMQQLLLIEQAYSANAKVIQTVDDMIKTLLEI